MNIRLLFISAITVVLSQSCYKQVDIPIENIENLSNDKDYAISDWKLVGPFYLKADDWIKSGPQLKDSVNGEKLYGFDNLVFYGSSEEEATTEDLKIKFKKKGSGFEAPEQVQHLYSNKAGMLDFENMFNPNKPSNIYASCIINSPKEQEIVLLTGTDDGAKIFINGEETLCDVKNPYRLVYHNYIPIKLNAGDNFLLIKILNTTKSWITEDKNEPWRFVLNYCTPERFNNYYLKLEKIIIKRPVVPINHQLETTDETLAIDPVLNVTIKDYNNRIVSQTKEYKEIELEPLNAGLYNLELETENNSYNQYFFYGDIHKAFEQKYDEANKILQNTKDLQTIINIKALLNRYDTLSGFYKKDNFFKISEFHANNQVVEIDSVIAKPTRHISLNRPEIVRLKAINMYRNPLNDIEFYKKEDEGYKKLNYYTTKSLSGKETKSGQEEDEKAESIKDPFFSELYFYFYDGHKPDMMQILTHNGIDDVEVERRYIFLLKELMDIISDLKTGKDAFKNKPGTHLRGFRSDIDNSQQYYLVHAPDDTLDNSFKRPLVVFLPWIHYLHIPFLRGSTVADIYIHEKLEWLVNETGAVALSPNARTFDHVATAPINLKNVLNTIEAIKKDYNIDEKQIHLYAHCGGADLAATLASMYPSKFASLGIVGGFISPPRGRYENCYFPVNNSENLSTIPIKIVHGEHDTHTPIDKIARFVDIARRNGNTNLDMTVDPELPFEAYPKLRHQEEQFSFFKSKTNNTPNEIVYSSSLHKYHNAYWISVYPMLSGVKATIKVKVAGDNIIQVDVNKARKFTIHTIDAPIDRNKALKLIINGNPQLFTPPFPENMTISNDKNFVEGELIKDEYTEGPIPDAFDEKFIVVQGTIGGTQLKGHSKRLTDEFIKLWLKNYYTKPIIKRDTEISPSDISESNLVLIGNQHSNKLFSYIYREQPLEIGYSNLILDGKEFKGANMGYTVIFPNPLNPKKYVVLIGGNNLEKAVIGENNPAEKFLTDFRIVKYDEGKEKLVKQGFFNENWRYKE